MPRCRVRYSFGQKWKTGTGKQYFTDIIGLSSTTVNSMKKTQNKGYYGVQGHSRSSSSVPIESPYATSYWWLIEPTFYLVPFRSYRSLLFKFWTLRFWAPLWEGGGGLGTTYAVYLGLIGKRVVDSLLVLIELLSLGLWLRRYERISVQNRRFRSNGGQFIQNFR